MLHTCQPGTTTGFPISLSQSLYSKWPSTDDIDGKLKGMTVPTDFTVQWGPPAQSVAIQTTQTFDFFQIRGFDSISYATTLNYGAATYACSSILSIVQNQHPHLSSKPASYEVILAFQIRNKALNPSSPDIILMCRPLAFSTSKTTPFWTAVNEATKTGAAKYTSFDLASLYAYNAKTLRPMVTYQTCMPVKLLNYNAGTAISSLSVRVHVVPEPIYAMADPGGTGLCSSVTRYRLTTEPLSLFNEASANTIFQFMDGLGDGGFPAGTKTNLTLVSNGQLIKTFNEVLQKFEILVPEESLGKSLAEIAESVPPVKNKNTQFKCYRVDPDKDIKNGQILIDPTTGESLSDTLKQQALESVGGDPELLYMVNTDGRPDPGIMPGDIQYILFIILTALGSLFLLAYLGFIVHTFVIRKNFNSGLMNAFILVVLTFSLSMLASYFEAA